MLSPVIRPSDRLNIVRSEGAHSDPSDIDICKVNI